MATTKLAMKLVYILLILFTFTVSPAISTAPEGCGSGSDNPCVDKAKAFPLKIVAIVAILTTSLIGVTSPLFSNSISFLRPDGNGFMIVKCFSSGIILGTGFMHVLPDSFEMLSSECLSHNPWHRFPFAGFVAMLSGLVTLAIDSITTSLYTSKSSVGPAPEVYTYDIDQEKGTHNVGHNHSHGHGVMLATKDDGQLLRYRVIAMVLELGILFHSVVIGLSLGATNDACTIKGLIIALCFHHLFEGIGLGGCILQVLIRYKFIIHSFYLSYIYITWKFYVKQADFANVKKILMALFFAGTTPCGIILGIALSSIYSGNSPTALITIGLLNACSAGMLIYMALVDLLATEFMGSMLQGSVKLQIKCFMAALLGCAVMSIVALWA
ncbi:fe(2+) transport protein 2 isoform X1 [Capsella rubella]|uniref:fe(2+) transport protein 2 isoform X1 n=1 Tax=Capsella rubella TaxID=81985 RepID=UPI000CD5B2D0|nr:fe(2+) transport protein 2 isoform X1 [Capsella rubella]